MCMSLNQGVEGRQSPFKKKKKKPIMEGSCNLAHLWGMLWDSCNLSACPDSYCMLDIYGVHVPFKKKKKKKPLCPHSPIYLVRVDLQVCCCIYFPPTLLSSHSQSPLFHQSLACLKHQMIPVRGQVWQCLMFLSSVYRVDFLLWAELPVWVD